MLKFLRTVFLAGMGEQAKKKPAFRSKRQACQELKFNAIQLLR